MHSDVIVLGAGMVGISAALHLQSRGRSVVLVDRRGPAEETSFGNAGVIQREAVLPYTFPRDIGKVAGYALNRLPEANLHWSALPALAPWLYAHWRQSTPEKVARTARAARPLVERCVVEHEALRSASGTTISFRETGYLKVYRTQQRLEAEARAGEAAARDWGVAQTVHTAGGLRALEPNLMGPLAGGILKTEAVSVDDPGGLGAAYARLFADRGGKMMTADARTLSADGAGWRVATVDGAITAREVVVALGPWAREVLDPLGLAIPLAGKRGYHMHYGVQGNGGLERPVLDVEIGYVLAPMARGMRLTTGAEFAMAGAPPTPVQIDKVLPYARELVALGDARDASPWMGRRPCLPDMLPMIGPSLRYKGLWLNVGHHHLGFTLGPVSGRLLAEMMTGQAAFTDPAPYRIDRF